MAVDVFVAVFVLVSCQLPAGTDRRWTDVYDHSTGTRRDEGERTEERPWRRLQRLDRSTFLVCDLGHGWGYRLWWGKRMVRALSVGP